jgi:single-strand DNA-binding protein
MSVNKAIIVGRLGQDPEVRYTQSNAAVATLSIATSEKYKDRNGQMQESTEWHRCVAWGRTAEICQQYLKKGSLVYIEGPIQTRSWEDKSGEKKYTTEIKVLSLQMLDSKGMSQDNGGYNNQNSQSNGSSQPQKKEAVDLSSMPDKDEDLPF